MGLLLADDVAGVETLDHLVLTICPLISRSKIGVVLIPSLRPRDDQALQKNNRRACSALGDGIAHMKWLLSRRSAFTGIQPSEKVRLKTELPKTDERV